MYSKIATALIISAFAVSAPAMSNRPEQVRPDSPLGAGGAFTSLTALENPACGRVIIYGTFVLTGTVDEGSGAESFAVNIWDDGNFITSVSATVPVGTTQTFWFSIVYSGAVLNGATGVGVYLEDAVGPAATATFAQDGNLEASPTTNCPAVSNSIGVFGASAQSVPVLGPFAASLLAGAIGVFGMLRQRRAA